MLDGRLRQSLVTVRSLGRLGRSVAAVDTVSHVPAFSSRWCRSGFVCPAEEGTDAYVAYLEEVLERVGARILISSADGTIALLRRHRARVQQRVRIALADEPALAIAVSKERTLAVAKRLGIGVPRTVFVSTLDEVPAALKEIGLPAVVKPSESWLGGEPHGAWMGPELVTTLTATPRRPAATSDSDRKSTARSSTKGVAMMISLCAASMSSRRTPAV